MLPSVNSIINFFNPRRFCVRAENHKETPGSYIKKALIFMLIVLAIFGLRTFHNWGMWDTGDYTNYKGCSEMIYNFPLSKTGADLYHDKDLMKQCHVYASNEVDSSPHVLQENGHPIVHTKCGDVKPRLVNLRKPRNITHHKDHLVPNIVHYINLGSRKFKFLNYMSFLSVHRFIKPEFIFIHGDGLPFGDWWNKTIQEIPNIYHVTRDRPMRIQGKKVQWIEHSSDVIRLQTLLNNGGIYLDTDILVVKSFDELRKYEVTLGRETSYGLGSGIIIAQPNSPFVCMWINTFRDYSPWPWHWATYAVWTPNNLAGVIPAHVHIEEKSLQRPSWAEPHLLFKEHYDWSENYAVHVWHRYGHVPDTIKEMESDDCTLGEIMRYIYYGKKDLIMQTSSSLSVVYHQSVFTLIVLSTFSFFLL